MSERVQTIIALSFVALAGAFLLWRALRPGKADRCAECTKRREKR